MLHGLLFSVGLLLGILVFLVIFGVGIVEIILTICRAISRKND